MRTYETVVGIITGGRVISTRTDKVHLDWIWPQCIACIVSGESVLLGKRVGQMQGANDLGLIEEADGGPVVRGDIRGWDDLLRDVGGEMVTGGSIVDEDQRS